MSEISDTFEQAKLKARTLVQNKKDGNSLEELQTQTKNAIRRRLGVKNIDQLVELFDIFENDDQITVSLVKSYNNGIGPKRAEELISFYHKANKK